MELKRELKEMIIAGLKLTNVTPDDISDDGPLFGTDSALGLDSLDAVELVVLLQKKFGVEVGDRNTATAAFASINSLAEFLSQKNARA
ncbi:MAG: phosphopantetheine-binding protein [Candidatus Aminicenantales bacterium]